MSTFTDKSHGSYNVLWDVSDNADIYDMLEDDQFYNHFPNNAELTTKAGLSRNLLTHVPQSEIHPDYYFPRSYDFGDAKQIDEFMQDFYRTALMSSLKKHVEYFWKHNKESLEFIDMEIQSLEPGKLDGIFLGINYQAQLKVIENKYKATRTNLFGTNTVSNFYSHADERDFEDEDLKDDFLEEEDDVELSENLFEASPVQNSNFRQTTNAFTDSKIVVNCSLLQKMMSYIEKMVK